MAGWSDTGTINTREKRIQLNQEVKIFQFPKNEWVTIRLIGPINSYAWAWLWQRDAKDKKKKPYHYPRFCLDYNPNTGEMDKEIDPFRKAGLYFGQRFISNAIIRGERKPKNPRSPTKSERKPREIFGQKFYIKEMNSKTFTPVQVCDFPATVKDKIVNYTKLLNKKLKNKLKGKKIEISDPKYGIDLMVMYDPDKKGAAMWDVQMGDPTPLKESELKYHVYDIEHLESIKPEKLKVAKQEWERVKKYLLLKDSKGNFSPLLDKNNDDDEDEDLDDDDTPKKKKKKGVKSSSKKKSSALPWEEDDSDKKKSKKKNKKSKKDDIDFEDMD